MSAASLEFIMAGNEQYRSNAFQSAEAGIEQSLTVGALNPGTPREDLAGVVGGNPWTSSIFPQLGGAPQPAIWGSSWNSFSTYHFEIQSTGTSIRGAQALNAQGVAVIAPYDSSVVPDPNLPSNLLN
jgi:hypothetical protein